jgi:large repetitive protein
VPGTYLVRIVDQFTNCVATDTVTVTDNAVLPELIFNQPDTLTCDSASITLSATVSTGAGIATRWFFAGAQVATNVSAFTVTQPGFYTVEVENTLTGCISVDSIEVVNNLTAPTLGITPPSTWTCLFDSIPLIGSIITGNVPGMVIWWEEAAGGNSGTILGDSSLMPVVLAPGTYTMYAANPFTGCIGEATVTVEADSLSPTALAGADREIGCDGNGILLDGNGVGGSINAVSFAWIGPGGGVIANTDTVTINDPGVYVLRVTDQVNGCSTTDSLQVVYNSDVPVANIIPDELRVDCTTQGPVTIPAEVIFAGNFTFTWTSSIGGMLVPGTETSLTPQAETSARYVLTVVNPDNMCSTSDSVTVIVERDPPVAVSSQDFTITCADPSYVLRSTGSASGSNIVYNWYLNSLSNPLASNVDSVVASEAGVYILEVINTATSCSATDTTIITSENTPPQISVLTPSQDLVLNCVDGEVTALIEISPANPDYTIEWAIAGPNGNFVSIAPDSLSITVDEPGFYAVRVTDPVTGCVGADTLEVILDFDAPSVSIEPDTMRLDCSTDTLTLPGQISSGGGFTFEWQALNGGQLVAGTDTSQTPQTETAGMYILIATNTTSLCTASDTVIVVVDRDLPTAVSNPDDTLTCADPTFKLEATGSSVGDNITYNWYLGNLNTLIAAGTDAHIVNTPGTYILQVINTLTGCTATDTTVLTLNGVQPMVSVLTQSIELFITCDNTEVTAEIGITPFSPDLIIEWSITGPTGNFVSIAPDSLSITVDQPGIYTVRVTDPVNGCVGVNEVVVDLDTELPTAVVNSPQGTEINCITSIITLNGNGSSAGPDFSYEWNVVALGNPPVVITPLQATVNSPGIYELVVTDNANGCVSRRTIVITQNISNPVAIIADPDPINCNITIVSLNGNGSTTGAGITATWNSLDGGPISPTGNPLQVNVSAAGRYELVIRDEANGCEGRDTVTVTANVAPPVANAGADQNINCNGTNVTLNGSASTPAGGVTFLWSAISGGGPINGTTIAMPMVNTAGTYQLIVTDTQTGCRDTATVVVTVINTLEDAFAGENFRICAGDPVSLSANLPTGATGLWTSPGSVTFSSPTTGQTNANNLQAGANTVIWTLSNAQCLNYSADTVIVTVQAAPQAGNDLINIPTGEFTGTANLVANDMLFGATSFSVSIINGPTLGRVDTLLDGILRYSVAPGVFGQDQIRYQICNTECPGLCDTALVQINIEQTTIVYRQPNAITPNGDGLNDELIFDQLLNTPDLYPNHELIIFNRWNDIVFRASPYLNDWRGTNQSGQDLPQGTYYYILRLNIAEGEIVRGDITILK